MGKKSEKKLCWNCDGYVSQHLQICPYCNSDLNKNEAPSLQRKTPFGQPNKSKNDAIPKPLYPREMLSQEVPPGVNQGWKKASEELKETENVTAVEAPSNKNELMGLLLLLPGVVLLLFSFVLLFFSKNGVLSLQWNEQFAYFYFLGAIPLLVIGWRFLK